MPGVRTEKLQLSLPGNPQQVPKLPAPRLLFLVRKQQSRITQFPVTMGSTPPPPLILRRPLPAVLRRSPDGSTSTASRPMGDGKRQKTASARVDPCCPCSISSTCSERNCPCAKARRPCRNCDPGRGKCSNTVAAHNAVIREANRDNLPRSASGRFCERLGLPPRPLIPLIVDPATRTGADNELATTATPTIQRHIRRAQRRDGTPSTSSGASREEHGVATSPDGGDTSSPIKLSLIFLISSQ